MELTIDGETFRVEVEGADSSPAVLLSCSLGTDLSLFDPQMPVLLEHFRVVRYDPRGHGRSTTAGAPYALARLGRDALAILDALEIETAHVVGVSMGGAVGQWLLVNAPERIGRVVLANTAARFGTPELWNTRIATVLAQDTQALSPATMERWFSPTFRERAPERVAAVEAIFRKTSAEGYAGACAALRDMDMREAIHAIARPVLVVSGREDPVTSAADIAALTGAIPGARHVELDCRHISNIEQDQAFNAAVIAFLTAPLPARATRPRNPPTTRRAATGRTSAARSPLKSAAKAPAADSKAKPAARGSATTPAKSARRAARGAVASTTTTQAPTPAKTATKKTATKKSGTRKVAARKATRKPSARRSAPGRPARKAVAVRVTARKAAKVVTKTVAKKTPAKKTASRKATPKKPAPRRPGAPRRPSPKRPGRPGGRKR